MDDFIDNNVVCVWGDLEVHNLVSLFKGNYFELHIIENLKT